MSQRPDNSANVGRCNVSLKSTRSSSGPESRVRYRRRWIELQEHGDPLVSKARPHGQVLQVSTRWNIEGNSTSKTPLATRTTPLSIACRSDSSAAAENSAASSSSSTPWWAAVTKPIRGWSTDPPPISAMSVVV
jgi:hypothetical protein